MQFPLFAIGSALSAALLGVLSFLLWTSPEQRAEFLAGEELQAALANKSPKLWAYDAPRAIFCASGTHKLVGGRGNVHIESPYRVFDDQVCITGQQDGQRCFSILRWQDGALSFCDTSGNCGVQVLVDVPEC